MKLGRSQSEASQGATLEAQVQQMRAFLNARLRERIQELRGDVAVGPMSVQAADLSVEDVDSDDPIFGS